MHHTFDVIVIGAGIMGCATAYELAQRGLNVGVVEKRQVGAGSTGKSSAIIRQHYSNALTASMALWSLRVFQDFDGRVGGECGFRRTGFVALVAGRDRAGLEANIALQQRLGIQTEALDPAALAEILPTMRLDDIPIAAYEPESGYADPYLTVTSYAAAARRHGARFFLGAPVTGIFFQGGRVTGVETPQGRLAAPVVVNATGAWGAGVARLAGVEAPIRPCRAQVAFFRRPAGDEAGHPVVADFLNAIYFRSETGALTLVGLIDPGEANAVIDPDAFDEQMEAGFVLEVGERLIARYPGLERGQSTGGYAAFYAITPDWHPIIDEAPAGSGHFICAGFSGHGFKLGPAVGRMMADRILATPDPVFDPHLFRLDRYAQGQPVRGQYEYSIVG